MPSDDMKLQGQRQYTSLLTACCQVPQVVGVTQLDAIGAESLNYSRETLSMENHCFHREPALSLVKAKPPNKSSG